MDLGLDREEVSACYGGRPAHLIHGALVGGDVALVVRDGRIRGVADVRLGRLLRQARREFLAKTPAAPSS
jgi:hypothetical protein